MSEIENRNSKFFFGLSFLCSIICFALIYFLGGIHYGVNDDIAMKEIASGVRSGVPDGHLVYIKYPLGWFISKLYCFGGRSVDWYGIFMVSTLLFSNALILYCIFYSIKNRWLKILFSLINVIVMMKYIFFIQWTVCALYCGVSGVLFYFCIHYERKYYKIMQKIIAVGMLLLCYLIRDKVFFVIVATSALLVFYKEFEECQKIRETLKNCLLLGIMLGIVVGTAGLIHQHAYSSEKWQEYIAFNKARSLMYDFYKIPDYEENEIFYTQKHISFTTYNNLKEYALLYDSEINTELITEIVNYKKNSIETRHDKVRSILFDFSDLIFSENNIELKCIMCAVCSFFLFLVLKYRRKRLGILGICQFFIWLSIMLWLIHEGRYPEHIIYMMAVIFIMQYEALCIDILKTEMSFFVKENYIIQGITVVAAVCAILAYSDLNLKSEETDRMNYSRDQIKVYMNEYTENLYILPVLTFSKYTDSFRVVNMEYNGKQLSTGGWLSHSPLVDQCLESVGILRNPEDFINNDNVYILNWEGASMDYILRSLSESCQTNVECNVRDVIETIEGEMYVYSLNMQED